jgi:arylformamidase
LRCRRRGAIKPPTHNAKGTTIMSSDETTTRRTILAAGAAAAASGVALAQQPGKGPRVWLDMDQQQLDDAYDQIVYAPNRDQVGKRRIANSERARAVIGAPQRVAYGQSEIEKLDIYRSKVANAPVNIFIHGGAWRANKAADYAFLAEPFVKAGAHYVILDFTNVDETQGSLFPMVEQVCRAVGWVYRNAGSFGGDSGRLYLTSHSSGSHIGGCVVTHDWRKDGFPLDILKGATLSSGMYDLKPVRLSKRSKYVKFTDEMEEALSAQRHLDLLHTPLVLAHGTYETPEFQRQTRDFHAAVKAAGKPVELIVGEGYNHFEMLETLGNPYGLLGRAVFAQMGLTAAA